MYHFHIPGPATKGKKKPAESVQHARHDFKALLMSAWKTLLSIAERYPGVI